MSEVMGKRLKNLREKRGLAQKFVAEKIGVKNNTLSGYESGNRQPDSDTLTKLADFYDVTTDYLHGRTDDPKPNKTNKTPEEIYDDPDFQLAMRSAQGFSEESKEQVLKFIKMMEDVERVRNQAKSNKKE